MSVEYFQSTSMHFFDCVCMMWELERKLDETFNEII